MKRHIAARRLGQGIDPPRSRAIPAAGCTRFCVAAAISLLIVTSCQHVVWTKAGFNPADWNRDRYECERDMRQSGYYGGGLVGEANAASFFASCLIARGYYKTDGNQLAGSAPQPSAPSQGAAVPAIPEYPPDAPPGFSITTVRAGTGAAPKLSDTVKVHYQVSLLDGTIVDSSILRGVPASLPLTKTIPCWQIALPSMRVGGRSVFTCPPEMAYGASGSGPKIKPGATLKADVELLEILD